MPPKTAAKKTPATLTAEALAHWTDQENDWYRARIVLQRSLQAARKHLQAEVDLRDELADKIELEAQRRASFSSEGEKRFSTTNATSTELAKQLQDIEKRLALQHQLLMDAGEEKTFLGSKLRSLQSEENSIGSDVQEENSRHTEALMQRWRAKIVHHRRRLARTLALESQVERAQALSHDRGDSTGAHLVVVLGTPEASTVSALTFAKQSTPEEHVFFTPLKRSEDTCKSAARPDFSCPARQVVAAVEMLKNLPSHKRATLLIAGEPLATNPDILSLAEGVNISLQRLKMALHSHLNISTHVEVRGNVKKQFSLFDPDRSAP